MITRTEFYECCQKKANNIGTRQVPRPTSYGKWDGATMSIKAGNFPFQACTAQNWLWMGKYGTYLELNASQGAPKHCQTFDSFIQFWTRAHLRSPRGSLKGASKEPRNLLTTILTEIWFHCWKEILVEIWWLTNLEAPLRLPRGDLKCALVQNWVNESKVWQCLGASWDAFNSRYVPYFPIRSQFWAVQARKEKLPAFKDKWVGEPV